MSQQKIDFYDILSSRNEDQAENDMVKALAYWEYKNREVEFVEDGGANLTEEEKERKRETFQEVICRGKEKEDLISAAAAKLENALKETAHHLAVDIAKKASQEKMHQKVDELTLVLNKSEAKVTFLLDSFNTKIDKHFSLWSTPRDIFKAFLTTVFTITFIGLLFFAYAHYPILIGFVEKVFLLDRLESIK